VLKKLEVSIEFLLFFSKIMISKKIKAFIIL